MNWLFRLVGFIQDRFERQHERAPETILLERPVERSLPAQSAMPRFRTSATDRSSNEPNSSVRMRIREAFLPSQPVVSRTMFAGRLSLLKEVIEQIEDQRAHIVLYGERGIGKTSLLRILSEAARQADYLVIQENCGASTTFSDLFVGIASRIPVIYCGGLPPAEAQTREGQSFADLLPSGIASPSNVSSVLAEFVGTRLVIILDEFDRVESNTFERDVAELIKNLSDASARVQLVIAGVAQDLQDLLGHSPSIRRNVVGISVSPMDENETAEIIELGRRHTNLQFDQAAVDRVVDLARGRPYLARLLAFHASLAAVEEDRSAVSLEHVDAAVSRSASEMGDRLAPSIRASADYWVSKLNGTMSDLARASLSDDGELDVEHLAKAMGKKPSEVETLLDKLSNGESRLVVRDAGDQPNAAFVEETLPAYLLMSAEGAQR